MTTPPSTPMPPGAAGGRSGAPHPEPDPHEKIADLAKQSGVYGLGALATQLAGFFLLPILARVLTPAQYGVVFLAEMAGLLMFVVSELGLSSAFFRFYGDEKGEEGRSRLVYTIFNLLSLVALTFTIVCVLLSESLSRVVFGETLWRDAFILVSLTNLVTVLSRMPLDLLRMHRRAGLFVFISALRLLGTFLVSLYLVVYRGRGVVGVLEGALVGAVLGFVALAPVILRRWKPTMDLLIVKRALRFGMFLVPAGLAVWALNQSDRYLLRTFGELSMVAMYGVGFKFGSVMNVFLVTPFLTAWTPFMFRVSTQDNARELYARVLTYFLLASVWALVALSVGIGEITKFVAGTSYSGAAGVVPFIAMGLILYGVASIVVVGIYLKEKTYHVSVAMILGAAVKIILSVLAIPRFGVLGVALATAVAFAVVVIYFVVVLWRLFPVEYETWRILKIAFAGLVSYALLMLIPVSGSGGLAVRLVGSLGYFVILLITGFARPHEIQKVKDTLRRLLPV